MPLNAYFEGHGEQIMRDLVKKHGAKEAKRIVYATAKKKNQAPKEGPSVKQFSGRA